MKIIKKIIKKIPISDKNKKFIRRITLPPKLYFLIGGTKPVSKYYGFDRGKPLDRFYIENFLEENKGCIKGVCLEVLNNKYTIKYGKDRVLKSDILDIEKNNKDANIIGDIRDLKEVENDTYDCIVLTQVLQFIDNLEAAISECHRVLKKDGILLATLPSISRIDCVSGTEGDFWRFTKAGARYLFEKSFNKSNLEIKNRGNVKSGIYFLSGFSVEDISTKSLYKDDENFPSLITVKARKMK